MSWSHVASSNGSSSAASFSPTWPAGVAAGDLVVFCLGFAPDSGPQSATVSAAVGWDQGTVSGAPARFMWAKYGPGVSLPVIALAGGPTATWHMVAMRSTAAVLTGANWHVDGTPPAATNHTTTTPNTLLFLFGWGIGDQSATWTLSGGSWTALVNADGNGTGNSNYANVAIAWREVASPSAVTGLRATLVGNMYFLLAAGEQQFSGGFWE